MRRSFQNSKRLNLLLFLAVIVAMCGCRSLRYDPNYANLEGNASLNNPLLVPLVDRWVVMDQVSDELDDYFRIAREERIRVTDGILSEGWIETHPKIGATLLEPWHEDSTSGFERIHATLQTVRRQAKVRVIPSGNAYQIDVKVFKELENLDEPVGAAIGGDLYRHDSSLDRDNENRQPIKRARRWIPMGRDLSLEQKILRNIQQRLFKACETCDPSQLPQ